MSMLPSRPQDAFVYNRKTQQIDPLNLIATDKVKCINCEKYYPHSEIQGHMMSHANQQLRYQTIAPPLVFNNRNLDSQPLRLGNSNPLQSSKVSSSTFDVLNQPIDVRTMTDNQLPQPEFRRREMQLPLPREAKLNSSNQNSSYRPIGLTDRTRVQPVNQITNMQIPIQTMRQHINAGDYFVPIELNAQPKNMNISPSAITLKRNMNLSTFIDVDSHVQLPKPQQDPIQQRNNSYRNRTYTVTPYKPQIDNIDFVPISEGPKTSFEVQDNRFLKVEAPSIIYNTSRKQRSNTIDYQSDNIRPITQTAGGNIGFSRITNERNNRSQINNKSRQTQRSGFLSFICGDPEDTLNNQIDAPYNPHLTISQYQYNHNHNASGRGCVCGTCGGFYCPQCKSTIPPQFRPCPPYLLNRQYQQRSNNIQLQTNVSGVTPTKSRQI